VINEDLEGLIEFMLQVRGDKSPNHSTSDYYLLFIAFKDMHIYKWLYLHVSVKPPG
jgi:hypothetical protein